MNDEAQLVTIYRSGDADADTDAARVRAYLTASGLKAVIFNDERPGVVQGSCEVRVPTDDVVRAAEPLAPYDTDSPDLADPSPEPETVAVAGRMGAAGRVGVQASK